MLPFVNNVTYYILFVNIFLKIFSAENIPHFLHIFFRITNNLIPNAKTAQPSTIKNNYIGFHNADEVSNMAESSFFHTSRPIAIANRSNKT